MGRRGRRGRRGRKGGKGWKLEADSWELDLS
jgi:hypothetical protein